jgi:hypothetical protein
MAEKSPNAQRVARCRADRRRIDYMPSPEALTLIEAVIARNPGASYHQAIDALLRKAGEALGDRR